MCLSLATGFQVLIPPTHSITRFCDYYKLGICYHILFTLCCYISTTWFIGSLSLVFLFVGVLSLWHSKEGISIQLVLLYCVLSLSMSLILFVKLFFFTF